MFDHGVLTRNLVRWRSFHKTLNVVVINHVRLCGNISELNLLLGPLLLFHAQAKYHVLLSFMPLLSSLAGSWQTIAIRVGRLRIGEPCGTWLTLLLNLLYCVTLELSGDLVNSRTIVDLSSWTPLITHRVSLIVRACACNVLLLKPYGFVRARSFCCCTLARVLLQ